MSNFEKFTGLKKESFRWKSGIYSIFSKIDKKHYVGSSINFYERFKLHVSDLKLNRHYNNSLQKSWNKYGGRNFKFSILEECSYDLFDEREVFWIRKLKATNKKTGFNKSEITNTKRKIVVLDLKSNELARFDSIRDAANSTGVLHSNISSVVRGRAKTANGLVFVYESIYDENKDYSRFPGKDTKRVGKFNKNGQLLEIFEGCNIAGRSVQGSGGNVTAICRKYKSAKSYKGFIWKYIE